jgi:hypothetical protein
VLGAEDLSSIDAFSDAILDKYAEESRELANADVLGDVVGAEHLCCLLTSRPERMVLMRPTAIRVPLATINTQLP